MIAEAYRKLAKHPYLSCSGGELSPHRDSAIEIERLRQQQASSLADAQLAQFVDLNIKINDIAATVPRPSSALDTQVGGSHYKGFVIQPVEFIHANGMPFIDGNIVKYVCRWRSKNGIADLEKARHYIELLIELETKKGVEKAV